MMKQFFILALASLFVSCAKSTSPRNASEAPCTVSDSRGCPEPKAKPSPPKTESSANDIQPFFETERGESPMTPAENPPSAPGLKDGAPDEISSTDEASSPELVIGEEVEEEIAHSGPTFDIPIVINAQVEKWIDYFRTRGKARFAEYIERSGRYVPMMRKILRENGLPEDLVYLAMIESGFKPAAYSRAKASGQWQFIKGTGSFYGLRVTWWVDERRDPEKATIAAAQHLKDLYDQFNHWYLAFAGYNAGAGKVVKAISKYRTSDFWEMSKANYRYLKPETKNYVPKMIAAALISKSPEYYGFTGISYEDPLEYDKVTVKDPTELTAIAEGLGMPASTLIELNPELRRNITPPDVEHYELKVPKGYSEKFLAAYPDIRKKSATGAQRYVVRKGDTLDSIARRYGVASSLLASFNRIEGQKVKRGMQLAIPMWGRGVRVAVAEPPAPVEEKSKPSKYRVRRGDTLWSISRRFDVSVAEIRTWNHLEPTDSLRPGKSIRLYPREDLPMLEPSSGQKLAPPSTPIPHTAPSKEENWKIHKVQSGESLWVIAQNYRVRVRDLEEWNQLDSDEKIFPGLELRIRLMNL